MNHIETLKQLVAALEYHTAQTRPITQTQEAITALRTAIEQAEKQEPVAWMKEGGFRSQVTFDWRIAKREGLTIPLYSRPQLACAPTHEPVATMTVRHTKNKTEIGYGPASKGYDLPNGEYKLYTTPPPAPVQEPVAAQCRFPAVAWAQCDVEHARMVMANPHEWKGYEVRLLYTTPPAAPVQGLEKGCHRSHPHENMDAMCELRTEIARLTNENARLKAAAQRQWVGLDADEKLRVRLAVGYSQFMTAGEYAEKVQDATEAKLREKNGGQV